MAEGRRMEVNVAADMEGNYPDSVSSSPRSRETDSDYFTGSANQRWEAVDNSSSAGGSSTRVRLMCSCGGKILPRPHDNQLAYVGGDTRILAVDRTTRFASMISKLSAVWGSGVSFKYQLPNEDLDSLVSVTNDEDLDNMMAEYDRLQKSGYKSCRLRLFVFANRGGEGSTTSLGSVVEEARREQWFVEALNNPPANQGVSNRSDCGSGSDASAWVNNMPDYLFGLENNNNQGIGGGEEDRITPRPSSLNSDGRAQFGANPNQNQNQNQNQMQNQIHNQNPVLDQSESSNSGQKGAGRISNSAPIQEISKPNEVSESIPQRPPISQQVPLQEFQNLQIRHQQQEQQLKQQEHQIKQQEHQIKQQEQQDSMQEPYMNVPGRKSFPDPVRAVNLPNPGQEVYMQQSQGGDYYRAPEPQQQQQQSQGGDYYRAPEPQQQQSQGGDYYRAPEPQQQQQQHQPVTYWQMPDQGAAGNGQYPVYLVPAGSNMNMMQTMTAVRPSPGYYNPSQRVNAAPSAYDAPGLVTTVRSTVPRQQQIGGGVSEVAGAPTTASAAEVYRDHQQQHHQGVVPLQPPPVPKVPGMYGAPMQVPVAGDMRMMYRPAPPVNSMPIAQPDSYAYPPPQLQPQQHVVYDPNLSGGRQAYYPQAVNAQYHQPMGPIASDINAAVTMDIPSVAAVAAAPEQQVKLGRVSPATS